MKNAALPFGLALRELKLRYEESVLGFVWAFVNPLCLIAIYAFFFGTVLGGASGDVPFSLHLFSGYVAWDLFGRTIGEGADILIANKTILTKVRLPLVAVFQARVLYHLFHVGFAAVVLVAAMLVLGLRPGPRLLLLPVVLGALALFTAGAAMIAGVLALFLKDLREVIPVVLVAWLFATPIFYDERMLHFAPGSPAALLYHLNPLYWFVEYTRACTVRPDAPSLGGLALMAAGSVALYLLGRAFLARSRSLVLDVL